MTPYRALSAVLFALGGFLLLQGEGFGALSVTFGSLGWIAGAPLGPRRPRRALLEDPHGAAAHAGLYPEAV